LKKPSTVEIGTTGAKPPITNIAHEPPAPWTVRTLRRLYVERQRIGTVVVLGITLLVGYHVLMGKNGWSSYQQKRRESNNIQQEIEQLKKENDQLRQHVNRLDNDPDEIEHEAREQLHYARPGEVIYTLSDKPQNTQSAPAQK
jgi:cell division protein FtsB